MIENNLKEEMRRLFFFLVSEKSVLNLIPSIRYLRLNLIEMDPLFFIIYLRNTIAS